MMDWQLIPFEPNLEFVLDLKEDLKTKYFEQHEKAKKTLECFSSSLRDIFHEHQKLLTDNIELSIINEKLKLINESKSVQQKISSPTKSKPSSILSSKNCNVEIPSNISVIETKTNEKFYSEGYSQKENISEYVPIFSSDFNSEIEDENFKQNNSPSSPVLNTPKKVQNSPILSKRKRSNSKRSNSSISSSFNSITSSNDSKISITHISGALEKNINDDIDSDSGDESVKEISIESSKVLENNFISNLQSCEDKDKDYKVLSVSKTNYGKSEFAENGKRLRQTTLTLKRVAPLIDISKLDTQENLNDKSNSKFKVTQMHCETTDNNNKHLNQNVNINKERGNEYNYLEQSSAQGSSKADYDAVNQSNKLKRKKSNNNDLIEISPSENESSKLRNKLINKKPKLDKRNLQIPLCKGISKLKLGHQEDQFENKVLEKTFENIRENDSASEIFKSKLIKAKNNSETEGNKKKVFEAKIVSSDDTFFSPAEMINNSEEDIVIKYKKPLAKRVLLNSFDEVPNRKEESPDFAYKEAPVRKKNCRAQLPGWDCRDCKKWYGHLSEEERKKRQNQCSKHRGKYKADVLTPESFWNPVFDDTHNSSSCDDL